MFVRRSGMCIGERLSSEHTVHMAALRRSQFCGDGTAHTPLQASDAFSGGMLGPHCSACRSCSRYCACVEGKGANSGDSGFHRRRVREIEGLTC